MNNKQSPLFQTLKDDIDYQAIANRMNVTVYEYQLSDDSIGHCFIALTDTNKWMLPTGEIVDVVKLLKTFEPESTGHVEINRFFKGSKAEAIAEELASRVTEKYPNVHYFIEKKYSKRLGHLVKLSLRNFTDQQVEKIYNTSPMEF